MTDPLGVNCPDCHARKGSPCVYMWPRDWDGSPRIRHPGLSSATLAMMDRAGTPTKRPHNGRYAKADLREKAARRKAREAELAARNAPERDREAILRANAQAVADEQRQLIAWLRANASVLTGA